jgi:L-seryl-tRNA(Ser) seleniumtransferase
MARRAFSSLRGLPAVETILRDGALAEALAQLPRTLVVDAVRAAVTAERARLTFSSNGPPADASTLAARAALRAAADARPVLRRVFNATGVVLHTNLGRAPLADVAREAVAEVAAGYANLEFDLESGARGGRGAGVERWLTRLTGAEAAVTVNNGAAAVLLVLSALASGRKVAVSRGELVEIGGSFRVPDIMAKSGATLVEVGTTNRTHLRDYEKAFERHPDLAAILRVHRSNFRIEGFTARPEMGELSRLARKRRVPLLEDLGSGALVDLAGFGLEHEPTVAESLAAGADLVTFSGDKLLGGAQAGMVLGARKWVERVRRDPLARAFRMEKLSLAALEATLALYADPDRARREIPVLAMLGAGPDVLRARAERLATFLMERVPGLTSRIVAGHGEVGGGSLPMQKLAGPVVEVEHPSLDAVALERRARAADPPVIGIVRAGRFRLDPRTLAENEIEPAARALAGTWTDARNG